MKYYSSFLFILALNISDITNGQNILINEVMTSNSKTYFDEYGDTPDWIELYNNSSEVINLEGYALSDNKLELQKWVLPSLTLNGNSFLIVNASGKNIKSMSSSWETIIKKGDYWKYFLGIKEPPSGWKDITFNDVGWNIGKSGIGYGDDDDNTVIQNVNSIYIRKNFNISDKNNIAQMLFNIDYDDGFVAYLNGIEIARANLGLKGEFIVFNRDADFSVEPKLIQGQKLDSYYVDDLENILIEGNNILSVQINNFGINSSDLTAIPYLTIGYKISDSETNIVEEVKHAIPTLHTNFKLDSGNETLFLSNISGEIIDSVKLNNIESDISFGRQNEGKNWLLFSIPTPGSSNRNDGFIGKLEIPSLNFPAGFYENSITLNIIDPNPDAKTYYTLDGSEPTINSNLFTKNLVLNNTKVLRLKSFQSNFLPSKTLTQTYFVNKSEYLPVISISTDPYNLWDYNYGIYVLGPNAESAIPHFGANYWQDWSRPVSFEFFEIDNNIIKNWDADVKIYGNWSRANAQKSLAVFAVGNNPFDYKFFDNRTIDKFESLIFRNSGNDWTGSLLRDGFIHTIANNLDIDNLAYTPSVLYLNGEYWGIHNIREKVNLSYFESHYNYDKSSIDLLELEGAIVDGDNESYIALTEFLNTHSLVNDANYKVVEDQIDIPSFIDYNLMQIYIANTDWPGNNNKFWRSRTQHPKWRWIIFDTDFGFGFIESYKHNTLKFATEPSGPDWPNPPWSTLNLRKLLENNLFKKKFINRFADLCNSVFVPENIKNILGNLANRIRPEIPDHIEKWNEIDSSYWEYNIELMNNFADLRVSNLKQYFEDYFKLTGMNIVVIENNDISAGKVKINSLIIEKKSWYGSYFKGTNIDLLAIANPGYEFIGWEGSVESASDSVEIYVGGTLNLHAKFQKKSDFKDIVINEINYNSNSEFDTKDWIELFNNSDQQIDISNWIFSDEIDTNRFEIPENTTIQPKDYLVISNDTTEFLKYFSDVNKIVGNFNFNISNGGELLRLYDNNNELIDSVRYDDESPWTTIPDGSGSTLELLNPGFDNSKYSNWRSSNGNGTPGKQNSNFITSVIEEKEEIPVKFELFQNYPNPFNPSTKIRFTLPKKAEVTLDIYNVIGEKVEELLNSTLNSGVHEIEFSNSKLASGIYYYKLKSGDFVKIKKMILLK